MLGTVLSQIIDYILPYRCASCSELTDGKNGVCSKCFQKLNFIKQTQNHGACPVAVVIPLFSCYSSAHEIKKTRTLRL